MQTLCKQPVQTLIRLHKCAVWPESTLVAYAIRSFFIWRGFYVKTGFLKVKSDSEIIILDNIFFFFDQTVLIHFSYISMKLYFVGKVEKMEKSQINSMHKKKITINALPSQLWLYLPK